ncbi:MAG: hypothetical protein ACPGYV_03920, partial [Phycisphaeraceae bacterium]
MSREYHCVRCDYNLTGIASGVCPECGGSFEIGDDTTCYEAVMARIPFAAWAVFVGQCGVIALGVSLFLVAFMNLPASEAIDLIGGLVASLIAIAQLFIVIIAVNTLLTQLREVRSRQRQIALWFCLSPFLFFGLLLALGV